MFTITRSIIGKALGILLITSWIPPLCQAADNPVLLPAATHDQAGTGTSRLENAVFAGGCFWGVQGVYQHVKGVTTAVSGYAGGKEAAASYGMVSSGSTGHAESVKVSYDPSQITYGQLLQIFFSVAHNPTELNRQGPDSGTQYRSAIFPQNAEQKQIAESYIAQLNQAKVFPAPIVTTIEEGQSFFPAENYHQDYLALNPYNPYIVFNDLPKVQNLARIFPSLYRAKPVLVKQ